jgi:pimeloyl-ACP methyl ester carboxylesterase
VRPHQRGGVFTEQCQASGSASEWVLGLDDYTRNQDICTYYYGYHPDYDPTSDANPTPTTGQVIDYTNRRMLHTIDWWRRTFAFDTTRTYAFGYSLGGYYSMQLALRHPERIAAAMSVVGKVDFSFEAEPVPTCMFNSGMPSRQALSRMWGTTTTNLPSTNGPPVYAMVSDSALATMSAGPGVSWLANFAGRNDVVVGWAEKLSFFAALEATRGGGVQFWDQRDHNGVGAGFSPMLDLTYLYRFRSDLSWPAFSHCSANGDPGNGWSSSGDTLGTINGSMEWDPALTDSATVWRVTLSTRALTTRWGVRAAPESLTVDVTPRRLQRFRPAPGVQVSWKAIRVSDGAQVQSGSVGVDGMGRITIPGVKTYRTGTKLSLAFTSSWLDAGERPSPVAGIAFTSVPNPIRGRATLALLWPRNGEARLELFDMLGRRARVLWNGPVHAGAWTSSVDLGLLPPGLYQLRASQGEHSATRRVARLR